MVFSVGSMPRCYKQVVAAAVVAVVVAEAVVECITSVTLQILTVSYFMDKPKQNP
jgi:hypothetical protein